MIFMRVLFFAHLKDVTGQESVNIILPFPHDPGQLWERLLELYPALAAHQSQVRLSRNWEYATAEMLFQNEDEVALIPPVSGG